MATEKEILEARRNRAQELEKSGTALFPARVPRPLDSIPQLIAGHADSSAESLEASRQLVRIAGRIVGLRSFGKASFVSLQADGQQLQVWMKRDQVSAERYTEFKLYEVGDFVWAAGPLIRTQKGELTVDVQEFGFLAKSYRPLPEKWHGLVDVEQRYRQRYLDILTNPDTRRMLELRSRAVSTIRTILEERSFLEVETPILQPVYGGANARPFTTLHNTYEETLFLRISFELYLKRLIIAGIDRVYEIGRDFRNEGISKKHNPEFSMLEVYQAYADYTDMMELTETLVAETARRVLGTTQVERDGEMLELAPPWPRRSMAELIQEACGVNIREARTLEALRGAIKSAKISNIDADSTPTWSVLVDELFSKHVEPKLMQPTFVLDYPAELSPLAKRHADQPDLVERFEAFIGGMEIANAFSELNDPDDQRARFLEQAQAAAEGDEEAHPIDEDFLRALEHGMPPSGGMGMGIGRLTMILTGASHLREVKVFPHLRKRDG